MTAVTDKDYSSYQDIREEAGYQHLLKLEELSGISNGSNTIYYAKRTYIVDRNYDDVISVGADATDVIAYVNSVAVTISAINADTGAITLSSAPATDATVLGTYAYSPISDIKVGKYRKEAIDYAQRKLKGIIDYTAWTLETIPPVIQTFVRLYAGALILIRDVGLDVDATETSKDGYKKLGTAKGLLNEYLEEAGASSGSTARVVASGKSDGNIFSRNTDLSTYNESESVDEHFMRG